MHPCRIAHRRSIQIDWIALIVGASVHSHANQKYHRPLLITTDISWQRTLSYCWLILVVPLGNPRPLSLGSIPCAHCLILLAILSLWCRSGWLFSMFSLKLFSLGSREFNGLFLANNNHSEFLSISPWLGSKGSRPPHWNSWWCDLGSKCDWLKLSGRRSGRIIPWVSLLRNNSLEQSMPCLYRFSPSSK